MGSQMLSWQAGGRGAGASLRSQVVGMSSLSTTAVHDESGS